MINTLRSIFRKDGNMFKKVSLALFILSFIFSVAGVSLTESVQDENRGAGWHLVESKLDKPEDMTTKGSILASDEEYIQYTEIKNDEEGDLWVRCHRHWTPEFHGGSTIFERKVNYRWEKPAEFVAPGDVVSLTASTNIEYLDQGSPRIRALATHSPQSADIKEPDDVQFGGWDNMTPDGPDDSWHTIETETPETVKSGNFPEGEPGEKMFIEINFNASYSPHWYYVYEWKDMEPDVEPDIETEEQAEAFDSGVRMEWPRAEGLGYRLFRSTSADELGISVTDFYLTSTTFADVNVQPNTTYYYTVKPVLTEADPLQGVEEELGSAIATFTVTTGDDLYRPGSLKQFIVLQVDNPYMSVNGIEEEIDPGRGTVPEIMAGRTMVPIRAIVEAMEGSLGWEGSTQKISITARGNTVEMWIGETDITVNGVSDNMDIAPLIQNERTYVPLRFAADNLDTNIDWLASTSEVVITYE